MSDLNKLFDEIGYFDQEAPIDDRGEFRKGATSALKNTISGGKALLGALTSDFSAQYDALTDMERTGRENAPKVGRIEDVDGLDKFGDWLAYNLGSGTASIGTMVAGGGLGGLAVKGLAKGALVNAGKAIGAGSMGFAPNYGESLNNAYEEAGEIENQAAFAAATIKTALDSLTPLKILRSTGRAGAADAITDRVKQKLVDDSGFKTWAKDMLKTGATEAFTEGLQSYTDQVMVNVLAEEGEVFGVRDWSELLNSAAAGAAGSAGFGTYSGVQQARIGAGLKQHSLNQNAYVDEILRKAPSIDDAINRGEQVDLTSTTKVVDNEETAYDPAIQPSINYDTPAVARNAGAGGSASEIYRFGNGFVDNASMRQGNRAAQQNPLVPMSDADEWQSNFIKPPQKMGLQLFQQQPNGVASYTYEGDYEQYREQPNSVPVGAALDAPVIDGEFNRPRALPNRADTIIAQDGRPLQQAQSAASDIAERAQRGLPERDVIYAGTNTTPVNENTAGDAYWQQQQEAAGQAVNRKKLEREAQAFTGNPQLPQKDIIFAEDGRNVQLKLDNTPFGGRRAVEISKGFKQAKADGLSPRVVKVNGGYGWTTSDDQTTENAEEGNAGSDDETGVATGFGIDHSLKSDTKAESDKDPQIIEQREGSVALDNDVDAEVNVASNDQAESLDAERTIDAPSLRYDTQASTPKAIDMAANEAATSPLNERPEPTRAQKEAGNYKKGRVKLHGLDIAIENPKGSTRTGTDPDGKEWSSKMKHHYGDIKGTTGADGDSIDVFIGDNPDSQKVFVVDQVDPGTGSFDEVKVMMGFDSIEAARKGYLSNYDKNWKGLGEISETTVDEFKAWTKRPRKSRQAFAYKPSQPESNAPLFSLSSDSIAANSNNSRVVSASDADKVVSRFADSFSNSMADSFVVASTFDDLPADIKDAAKAQGAEYQVKGVFHKGKTYVVSDQHTSELDVETTLFHEVYGHQGVAKLFGKDITKKLNELFLANGGLKGLRDTAKRHGVNLDSYINGLNGTAMPQDIKNRVLMDELLAHMQQSNKPSVKRLVREIVGMLRAGLRKLGLPGLSKVADSDLFYILRQARKATAGGKPSTVSTSSFRTSESTSIDDSPLFNRTMSNAKEKLGLGEEELLSIVDRAKKSWEDFSWKGFKERAKEGLFDSLYGIKKAEDAMNVTTEESGYISARLAQGVGDVVHAVMFHGAPQWRNGIVQMKPDTKGLLEVFSQLDTNELNDWLAWMGGNRADKLMKEGRENNLTANEIAELKGLNVGREALFNRVKDEYNAINAATLDMAIEAGLLSRDTVNKFDSEWYVPFFRAEDPSDIDEVVHGPRTTKGISNASAQIKTLKGGSQSTKDILQNILQRQATMIDAAMKNKAMIEVADNLAGTPYMQPANLNKMEIEAVIKKRLAKKATPYVSVVMDGETKWFEVQEPSLLRALTQLSVKRTDNPLMKMSRAAKRFLTTGVTLSPEFIIRNFLRDGVHGWMINKDKFTFGLDSAKGVIKTWKKDQATIDLMFAGASFQGGYVHAGDPEQGAQQIRRALRKKGMSEGDISKYMASIPKGVGELLEKYRSWSDSMENANRVATYDSSLKAGKSKKQAVFEAKDFMDFGLQGNFAAMQFFVDVIPFLNARMQGLYKLYRAGKAGKGDSFAKVLSKELAMKGMYVAGFSLALALVNMDDERYDELPDWDKDANWHFFFGDTHVRIPKPFELGIIFGTLPERLFMRASGKQNNDDLGRSMGHAVVSTMAMNPIPQIIKPGFEAWANYDMFSGRPIESFSDQYKRPEDRYSMYTTESAKRLAKLFGVSPKKLEHLVRGYTGTLGSYVLSAADVVGNSYASLSGSGEFKLNEFDDLSVVRAFVKTGEVGGTYYGEQFYDTLQEINGLYKQFQNAQQEQDAEAAKEIIDENKGKIRFRGMFNKAQAQLNKLNHQMTIIWKNEKIPLAEREKKIDEINSMKNAIYRRVVLEYRKLND